ncbi:MAG: aminotransferase class IV family protein [Lentimicrobium sp.]
MSRLFETISIRNGVAENLKWHQQRLELSYLALFGHSPGFSLKKYMDIPMECRKGHFRCRVDYDRQIREIRFTLYQKKEIKSLKLVEDNGIDYRYKFSDRRHLNELYEMRGNCDDVLIVKNGMITDTSFANVVLWDGRRWLTPCEPLLPGTCRARLIENGLIGEANIKARELHLFKELRLINALRGIDDMESIPARNIGEPVRFTP